MAKQNVQLAAFNRGIIDKKSLARVDVARVALSAEEQTNWLPEKLGPMSLRPGLEHLGHSLNDSFTRMVPFIFAVDDVAVIELTTGKARFWVNDTLVSFPTTSSVLANGAFDTDLTSWTDADEAGCTSVWAAGSMSLLGDGTNQAVRYQTVVLAAADVGKVHAVLLTVTSGECTVRIGSTVGGQEYAADTIIYPGNSTVAFTPTSNFYVQVSTRRSYPCLISSIVSYTGTLEIPTPWTSDTHLRGIRADQSGDVVFVACEGVRQQRIERRSSGGWGVVDYVTYDGPYLAMNITPTTLTPSALIGSITLTASRGVFNSQHVGALFSVESRGQSALANLIAQNTFTEPIRVFGVGATRAFTRVISGTWVGTLTLQRSLGEVGLWEDVSSVTNGTVSYNDALDNQIAYYRIGFKTAAYTSGTATVDVTYNNGTTIGAVRITGYTSTTVVTGNAVIALGSLDATVDWAEGVWSPYRGYPSAVALHEGRLWWAGKSRVIGSISDDYHSFDSTFAGDAGPLNRLIGSGPVDSIRWLMSTSRLIMGGQGAEHSCRSSALDEPLSPTSFNLKTYSKRGSAAVAGVVVDQDTLFVDKSGHRIYVLTPDNLGNHSATEVTVMCPQVALPGVSSIAVQRNPDTRVHCVRSDGKVAVLVYDPLEELKAWVVLETDGVVEDVITLPATGQDEVYYIVQRTINGVAVRHLEKMAHDDECVGGTVNKQADSFVPFTNGAPTATISGLDHLEGETVVCWADGKDQGTFTVASGVITLAEQVSQGIVGLSYRARFKSAKLAHAAQGGSALTQPKRIDHLGLILANTHYQGLQYGPDFDHLDDLPLQEEGQATPANTIWTTYDKDALVFPGIYDTDSRVCLQATAPRPCTVMAAVIGMQTNEKL